MQKIVISCKSKGVSKIRVNAFLNNIKNKNTSNLIKIKPIFCKKVLLSDGISTHTKTHIDNNLYPLRNKSFLTFKFKHDNLKKRAEQNGIYSAFILSNIHEIFSITKIYVKMYSKKFNTYISEGDDAIFTIIKMNQDNIKSIEEYRKMKYEEIITEEVLFELRYL